MTGVWAAGLKVQPFMVPYTTSQWAVRGMAKAFAAELARTPSASTACTPRA